MTSLAPFLWLDVVKSLYVQHTPAFCVLWQQQHFPMTVEKARHDSPGGEDFWFAHCFSEHGCPAQPQVHISCPGSWTEYSFYSFFFASIPFMQNFIKAPFYCETKFGMECVPTQQEKSYSSMWDGSIRHWKYLLLCSRKSLPLSCFKGWACYCSLFMRGN